MIDLDVDSIRSVSNTVKELSENVPKLQSLREALTNFADVDALVSGVHPKMYSRANLYSLLETTAQRTQSFQRRMSSLS